MTSKKKPQFLSPIDQELRFSFKYLNLEGSKGDFSLHHIEKKDKYLETLLERLKDLSCFKTKEFREIKHKSIRAHKIDWSETTRPDGFSYLNEQIKDDEAWQFELTANEYGRVHGFLIDNTFFIIWLDPLHKLYP